MSNVTASAKVSAVDPSKPLNEVVYGGDRDEYQSDDSDGRPPWAKRKTGDTDTDDTDEDSAAPHDYLSSINGLIALANGHGRTQCPCCSQTFRTQSDPIQVLAIWYAHGVSHYHRKVKGAPKGIASEGHTRMCALLKEHGYHAPPVVPTMSPRDMSKTEMEEYIVAYNIALNGTHHTNALKTISVFESKHIATLKHTTSMSPFMPSQTHHTFNSGLYKCWDQVCR
jgi:hypothetical protein